MGEKFGALIWLAICALSVLFWWPVLVVVGEYWIGVTVEEAATPLPEPEDAAQIASSAPASDAADPATVPGAELAYATEPSYSDEEEVSLLLAHAQDQVAKLALTTPEGDNAYETYQLILSFQPNNEPALDGIEQIGVKYVELANLAAAKGDFQKTRHYAAKVVELAPEHPSARSMTVPVEASRPSTQEAAPSPEILADFRVLVEASRPSTQEAAPSLEILADFRVPPLAPAAAREESARVEVAVATPATARPEELFEDADDLVLNPADYQGRQVAVAGPVGYVFWDYRLVAESGRNSIVIDIDRLSQADRDKLDAAIDEAGYLGEVRARIKGTVEPQFLRHLQLGSTRWSVRSAIFQLAATELSLGEVGASDGKSLGPGSDPDFDEATSLVVPVYPGEPLRNYQSEEDLKQAQKYVKSLPSTCIGEVIQAESGSVSIYTNCAGQRSKIKIWQGKVLGDYAGQAVKRARPI